MQSGAAAPEAGGVKDAGGARFLGVLACFYLSGFAALIYQTAWTRQFAFVFGTSELAVASVLAAYMGGLAVGAWVAGRYVARVTRPILAYGLIELGIAVAALAVPLGVGAAQAVYVAAFGAAGEPPGEGGLVSALFYLVCSFLILLPATALMGATLPLLARHSVRDESQIGSRIGALYTANTVGAVTGTVVAGFVLLPQLGLARTVWTAVAGNALVFGLAALLARGAKSPPAQTPRSASTRGSEGWILPLIAVSGSVSFLYEVLWTRMLGQILGASVYAFATMLGTFLTGIALGSWLASRLASTRERSVRGFAWAQLGTAACALGAFRFADRLPEIATSIKGAGLLGDAAICALVLLPSTIFIGATFPFAVRIHAHDENDASQASARVYSWNTVGSIVGAVGAGFFLVPAAGYVGSMAAGVTLNLLLAIAAVSLLRPVQRVVVAIGCAGLLLLATFPPERPWTLLSHSPLQRRQAGGELEFFAVGRSTTVQVRKRAGAFALLTNGLQEAMIEPPGATFAFSPLAPWMASLPSLLRPETREIMIVGLGGGGVVEAAPAGLERVDVVELEPEVVRANQFLAERRSIDPLADPRVKVTVNDARGSLLLTKRRYDAIVSQPSHPWTAGASHLYSREFFELARDRLESDGILLQWMGLGFVDAPLLQTLVATLLDVFDHVNLYAPIQAGVLLAASNEPFELRDSVEQSLADAPGGYASLGVFVPEDVETARILDAEAARRFAAGAPVSTDDHNLLQTRSPAIARKNRVTIDVEALVPELDPLTRPDPRRDAIATLRSLLQRGSAKRARRFAATLQDPAQLAYAEALLYEYSGRSATRRRRLFEAALALDPQSDAIKLAILQAAAREYLDGDEALSELAASMTGAYRALPESWPWLEGLRAGDPDALAAVRALLPQLAECLPQQSCFLPALRLRALSLMGEGEAEQALGLLDHYGWLLASPSDKLLRARAAALAGETNGVLALIFQVDVRVRAMPRQGRSLAREALQVLALVPEQELGTAGHKLRHALRRVATGQAGPRAR